MTSLPHEIVSNLPFEGSQLAIIAIVSFFIHFAVFYLTPIPASLRSTDPTKKSVPIPVIRNYIGSTFHAVIACSYVLGWFFTFGWPDLWDMQRMIGGGRMGTGDEYHAPMLAFSLGYFAYDTVCMMMYKEVASTASYIHHFCIGSAFVVSLMYNQSCRPYQFYMLFEELSTLPLNAKTIFKHNPFINHISSLLFAASFIGVRMVYGMGIYLTGMWQLQSYLDFCLKHGLYAHFGGAIFQVTMCSASRALNLYWTVLIINKVMATMTGGSKRK